MNEQIVSIINKTVTSISNNSINVLKASAFQQCSLLSDVNLPNVYAVNSYAFKDCISLINSSFPNCYMWDNGFNSAISIKSMTLSLPNCLYFNDTISQNNAKSVYIPNAIYATGQLGSTVFTSLSLPNCRYFGLGLWSQRYCSTIYAPKAIVVTNLYMAYKLTDLSFPEATVFGGNQYGNTSTLYLPKVVRLTSALNNNTSLSWAYLPRLVSIPYYAFSTCTGLLSLYLNGPNFCTLYNSTCFSSTPIAGYTAKTSGVYGSIFVRASLISRYQTALHWSYFSSRFAVVADDFDPTK